MRIALKKYKFIILSVCIVAGVSITGWALAFYNYKNTTGADSQEELKIDTQAARVKASAPDPNNLILVLVCMGLIGFFGVRRQFKTLEHFVRVRHPENSAQECFFNENNPEGRTCPGC